MLALILIAIIAALAYLRPRARVWDESQDMPEWML